MDAVRRVYDFAHVVLGAAGIALLVWIIAQMPEAAARRAAAERDLAQQVTREDSAYCIKWGLKANTHEHTLCMLDIQEIRAREQDRLAAVQALGL